MKFLSKVFFLLVYISLVFADSPEKFKQIRIFVPDKTTLDRIWSTGIDYEGSTGHIGDWMEFVAGDFELQELAAKGISYQIVIDDLASYYASRLTPGPVNLVGFGYGSMGGFYTYAEVIRQLDTMRLMYPNIITARDSIGTSREGRALWMVKISDNPELNEPGEPEVLYTALHHAREPQGLMAVLYYMWWLLENYGTNPEAAYLVNNRQMYFIPVVNPDGYVYNQTTNPNGGGMWRKNRRNNGGGIYGVDPNRNYGPFYMWDAPNGGSSTSPSSDTYRGTEPFSEPENQTIDRFMRSHNIKTCFNYHTYSNLLIYPWGYLSRENSDSLIYRDWAYDMTAGNRYEMGTDLQTVNYATRGNSDDYMFGDTSKPIAYTMTPEIGTTGFWPTRPEIFPLAIENLQPNKLLAYFAGPYPDARGYEIVDAGGNGFIDRGEDFTFQVRLKNKGLSAAANLSISASTNTPYIELISPSVTLPAFPSQSEQILSFPARATINAVTGIPFQVYLYMTDPQGFTKRDTINLFLGTPIVIFTDSASNGLGNWTTGQGWGLTTSAHTLPYAFTDSPFGNYSSSADNSLTLINQLSLSGFHHAQLKFWTRWAVEPTWDFATMEISTNNGSTWTTLRSKLSRSGSGRGSRQPAGSWGYDAYTPGLTWVEQDVDLSGYINRQIKLRFRMAANGSDQRDGFYVDDIRVYGYTMNADTSLVVRPVQFQFNGVTGSIFVDTLKIYNLTGNTVQITIAETTSTLASNYISSSNSSSADIQGFLARLKSAFQKANITGEFFNSQIARISEQTSVRSLRRSPDGPSNDSPLDPQVFTTIITDERNEFGLGAVDIYRVQYQFRTVPIVGNFHDFRIVLANLPDTNVAGFISIDTDQDFGTGAFPTPFGFGPTSRDVGSEREIFFDASGILFDSLGFGRIRAGIVINTENDSIVGIPFLLAISRDSVLTITTNGLGLGIRDEWLADPDRKMNVGVVAARVGQNVNPLADFAPLIGHGTVGAETGVSWLSEDRTSFTILARDSAVVRITALAAKPAGTYTAALRVIPNIGAPITVPVTMTVTNPPPPHIVVSPTTFTDTVAVGDSVFRAFTISNTGGSLLTYGILDTAGTSWLTVSPSFGALDSGQTALSRITMSAIGLTPDSTYRATVFVVSNDPNASSVPLNITLRVTQITAVHESKTIPTAFALFQNYPNPFNPETIIKFDLPTKGFVSLRVYNVLGQEVATLLNEELAAGRYSVRFNTGQITLASGVYFYRITAGSYSATKKMLVMK